MSDQPLEDQVQHRVENRVAWITLNRPEVRNAITPDQRERVIELLEDASARSDVGCGRAHRHRRGLLHRRRPARRAPSRPRPSPRGRPTAIMGDAARMIRRGAQRLVAAVLDCEKPVVGAVNGTAAGHRRPPGLRLRPGGGGRGGALHRGLRPPGHLPRRRRRLPAAPADRPPEGQGAHLLRRRPPRRRRRRARARQPGGAARASSSTPPASSPAAWRRGPTKAIGMAKWLLNRSLDSDRADGLRRRGLGPGADRRHRRLPARVCGPSPSAGPPSSRASERRRRGPARLSPRPGRRRVS